MCWRHAQAIVHREGTLVACLAVISVGERPGDGPTIIVAELHIPILLQRCER
jgi:hypothetical protein